jgi:hypothetical protein
VRLQPTQRLAPWVGAGVCCSRTCTSAVRDMLITWGAIVRSMSQRRVIAEAVLAGKSQRELAPLYGVAPPRVSQLVAAWRSEGWEALEPNSHRLQTLKKKWVSARPPATVLVALQALLDEFADYYNHRRKHRSLNRRTPAEAYAARAKASPEHNNGGHFRIRDDTVHATGSVTLRRGGRMHHIKLGTALAGTHVRMLVHDLHVIVIDRDTGEILRELDIDPTKDSQPRGVKPGPRPGQKKGGMPKGYKFKKHGSPGTSDKDVPGLHIGGRKGTRTPDPLLVREVL